MRKISDSTIRRLSVYLRFLEQATSPTISSGELARLGGTTSAQVRKDLSFFGSFGKRGLGYAVPELTRRIRDILGLERGYRVVLVGAGRMGGALVQYHGFRQRGFHITAIYDQDARKIGSRWNGLVVRDVRHLESDLKKDQWRESDSQFCAGAVERSPRCRSQDRQYGAGTGDAELLAG